MGATKKRALLIVKLFTQLFIQEAGKTKNLEAPSEPDFR